MLSTGIHGALYIITNQVVVAVLQYCDSDFSNTIEFVLLSSVLKVALLCKGSHIQQSSDFG